MGRHGVRPGIVAVERDDEQVGRLVDVPRVVSAAGRDDAGRVGEPARAVVLELAGRQVAGADRAVGGHDVHVLRTVEDPVLAVEAAEESFDLARRLPRLVLLLVPLVAGAARERDPPPVGRPREITEAVGPRADGAHLARGGDRHDVQRRVALLLAAPRGEGEEPPVGRPGRVGVVFARRQRGVVEPHAGPCRVVVDIAGGDDERHAGPFGREGHLTDRAAIVDDPVGDLGVLRPRARVAVRAGGGAGRVGSGRRRRRQFAHPPDGTGSLGEADRHSARPTGAPSMIWSRYSDMP